MATSESLKLSKDVDPDGERTLAVVTKMDLMDAGTDAVDILCGRVIPVKLGIIGVVNRSQQDIMNNKSIQEALKDEASFLMKRYPSLASRNGTAYLAKTLNRLLMHHIRNCLPDLETRLSGMMSKYQMMLSSYGDDVFDRNQTLLQIITKFATSFCATMEGRTRNIETTALSGCSRINYILHETFGSALDSIHPLAGLTKMDILTAIKNTAGPRPALFIPEVSFEVLVKREVRKLEYPSLRCVELLHQEMRRIIQQCGTDFHQEMLRFPKLYERIVDVATHLLERRLPTTTQMVENLVAMELAYIDTEHPDFQINSVLVSTLLKNSDMDKLKYGKRHVISANGTSNHEAHAKPVTTSNEVPVFNEDKEQRNNWLLSSLLPQARSDSASTADNSPVRHGEGAPLSLPNSVDESTSKFSPQRSVSSSGAAAQPTRKLSEREARDCEVIERLTKSYFYIARKSIQRNVVKAVNCFFINYVKDNLQSELVTHLYKSDQVEALLNESEHIAAKRKESADMLKALKEAGAIINELQETRIW